MTITGEAPEAPELLARAMQKAVEAWESQTSADFSTDGLEAACWAFHEYMIEAKAALA